MKQESKRLYSFIIAAAFLIAALVAYIEFIVPAYSNLETLKGQVEGEAALYTNENQIVTQGQSLLAAYENNASSSEAVSWALPVGQNLSGALAQIYGVAANSGVTLVSTGISIQAVAQPSAVSDGSQIANAASTGSIIKPTGQISFQASGAGSYEAIKTFLKGLEANIRIFDVKSVTISPSGGTVTKGQAANPDMFAYSITVVTYYQAP
jgi:hypothetical protein